MRCSFDIVEHAHPTEAAGTHFLRNLAGELSHAVEQDVRAASAVRVQPDVLRSPKHLRGVVVVENGAAPLQWFQVHGTGLV
jgi:hypothetical protein